MCGAEGDARAPAPDHLAPVDFLCACEDAKHRGLAGAVAAHEPNLAPAFTLIPRPRSTVLPPQDFSTELSPMRVT